MKRNILHWFYTDAAEKHVRTYKLCAQAIYNSNNSHDLNTIYTCDRYQQVQFLIDVGFDI
ncbi:hypothetical protein T03_5628 [Trichinella britovi]|uniref:Uncharacterized protein n=1 Tax=Trichinella britovi TaxID=45882 RepID=A0A0V1CZR5_TRIBR|nr:hypothetical protein T03_5628 [Trichinella britovi]